MTRSSCVVRDCRWLEVCHTLPLRPAAFLEGEYKIAKDKRDPGDNDDYGFTRVFNEIPVCAAEWVLFLLAALIFDLGSSNTSRECDEVPWSRKPLETPTLVRLSWQADL